ncbi:unnamed protein product [Symbiodinium sp. CCMP2592]|nr:unnamed protein product [Symbiodinium sp. CCMP2592]
MNTTGNEEDGLLLKLITKASDGSDIGTYAYRVTDTSVIVDYENAKIDLPVSFLRELQTDPDDVIVISLASFTNESFAYKLLAAASEPQGIRLLADPLSMNFFNAEGAVLETTSEDPIRLGLQVLEEDPSAECAFWHEVEQRWSTQGMSVDSLGNGTATCAIRYDLLPVVSARDGEAQDGDGEVEALPPRKPSLFGFILQAVGATFACSLASQIFSVEGLEALVADPNWVVRWPAIMTWVILVAGVALLLQAHRADRQYEQRLEQLLRKEAARDMLIEKAKKENIFFVKLRQLLEIRRQLLGMGARGMVADRAHWSILQARLGVDSTFLHSLYQVSGQTALHIEARQLLENFHAAGLCRRLVALHTAYCSWVRVLEPSLRVTCLERAAVALCKFYSGLAVAAVFYSQSAVAPGQDEGCSIFQDPLAQLIRTAVVAWVSAMVGLLPFLALMPLFEKLRSMELKTRHIIFWTFISTYLLTCILVVCIFQSMVSYKDTLDWMYSAAQTLAFSLILTPLLMATVVLLFVHSANIDLDEHLPFHAKDDHCYKVTLRNMTVSGEEWQDQGRRSQLCARWEIAGHPETATITTFQADADGEIELDGVMPYHALLVSIYLRPKSSTLRLLGNAALPSDKFIHSGFGGELPLYLRGKAVPGMQVGVSIARPAISQQAVVQRGRSSIRLTVQGNNVLAAEQELQQELEVFGICFEDDDDDATMPDDEAMPPEVTCQLAGITFDDDVVLESDFQKDCSELGITFGSDADSEDLRSIEATEHNDLSSSVAVVPQR